MTISDSAFVSESILIVEALYGVQCTTRIRTSLEQLYRCNLLHAIPRVVTGNQRFVCLTTDTVVAICFHGSNVKFDHRLIASKETIEDWQCNVNIQLSSADGICSTGLLHSGFASCYREVQSHVKELLYNELVRDVEIWLMGHSLGGAIALLCAMSLDSDVHHRTSVCTLGAPRVGDNVANAHLQTVFRIHNLQAYQDAVVSVPPLSYGYAENIGTKIKIGKENCKSLGEEKGILSLCFQYIVNIYNHQISVYSAHRRVFCDSIKNLNSRRDSREGGGNWRKMNRGGRIQPQPYIPSTLYPLYSRFCTTNHLFCYS